MRLGMAVAARLRQPGRHTRIVIGKDTRLSGYMFETALAAGIVAMGADVWLTGPLPTPGIAFITSSMRCDAGVVISASHNPFEDNGIKLFARDGYKLPDAVEAEIEALMASPDLASHRAALGRHRLQPQDRGRARPLRRVLQGDVPERADPRRADAWWSTAPTAPATGSGRSVFEELGAPGHRRSTPSPTARTSTPTPGRSTPRPCARSVRREKAPPRHRARRRCRSRRPVRRARPRHRRRRADGAVRDPDAGRGPAAEEHAGHHRDVEPRASSARCKGAGGRVVRTAGRRPLRRRGDAARRLQLRRRAVGPPHVPRSRDDRRRHHRGAARARGDGRARAGRCRSWPGSWTRTPQVLVNVAVDRKVPLDELAAVRG